MANPPWKIISATYDLHVGYGMPLDPEWSESIQKMVQTVTRKRIDVVVVVPGATYLVEIKPRAGMSALGQLVAYKQLFLSEHKPSGELRLACVCERVEPDLDRVFRQNGIELYVV
jgi:hypothetical protein